MALFHVARYAGPEAAGAEAEADGRARALLERLQCRARERQLQKQPPQQAPEEAAQSAPAAGKRRRRPRRNRRREGGREPGSTPAPPNKRQKTDDEDEDEGAESGEETPAESSVGAEAAGSPEGRGGPPLEEASRPLTHSLVLGGFGRSKVPKVQPFLPVWLAQPSCVGKNVTEGLVPIEDIPAVHPDLQKKLRAQGISSYFPVQAAVIPALLESTANGFLVSRGGYRPSDLCVSAPTGSGKTLAFVIPVVQALLHRAVCQVRALVVLPTKELAQQVSKVFNVYTDATPLRVALITGQKSLVKEQESLVQKTADGFRCLADIMVATPGRLVDHVDQTPGFSLQHLRFLVGHRLEGGLGRELKLTLASCLLQIIDEADRMIDSMHQSWLPRVVAAAFPSEGPKDPCALLQRTQPRVVTAASMCCPQMPLQKLLFSATLTQNPEKLQQLGLYQPRLFSTGSAYRAPSNPGIDVDGDSGGKYTFPVGLTHHYVPCSLRFKPLVILHLILEMNFSRVLCFTNSRENSHRLFLLVQAFGGVTVAEFSSRYGPGQRKSILKQFEQGKIQLKCASGLHGSVPCRLGGGVCHCSWPRTGPTAHCIPAVSLALTPRPVASTCRACSWWSTTMPPSICGPTCTGLEELPVQENPGRPSHCSLKCRRGGSSTCSRKVGCPGWSGMTPPASSCSHWFRGTRRPCPCWRRPSRRSGSRRQPRPGLGTHQ